MLFDDLVEFEVENAADLSYRTSIATYDAIAAPELISLAFDCFTQLEASGLEFWVTGGWVADLQLGRVLRDHEDVDLFVRAGNDDVLRRLRPNSDFQILPMNETRVTRGEMVVLFRERLPIDVAIISSNGETGSVWDSWFEFDLAGLEERKRRIVWNDREVALRCLSPELHYLFKLAGLKHFKSDYRNKDLADIRSLLPLLNLERLEVAKMSWRDQAASNSPAPIG
ncbi:hypothetical protein BH09CHL1_BH09CHL1_31600 [soil metagenome]